MRRITGIEKKGLWEEQNSSEWKRDERMGSTETRQQGGFRDRLDGRNGTVDPLQCRRSCGTTEETHRAAAAMRAHWMAAGGETKDGTILL